MFCVQGRERKYINDGGSALQVESTAYTLLTMAALNQLDQAGPIVIWLTEKRNSRGAFYSTQVSFVFQTNLKTYFFWLSHFSRCATFFQCSKSIFSKFE